ncbi:hypothetical protein JOD69_004939 [Methylocaldum sp. RMAD-M]|jgi:hypothetical protein|nr:hypothetical protein [Methylocaldum sp. RMAD-M]
MSGVWIWATMSALHNKACDFSRGLFTFLVHDRLDASRFPYHVQGGVMPPVRRSLKNQRTAQAYPITDIHRGIGVGVCLPTAAFATVGVFLPAVDMPAGVARFAGVGSWNLFNGYARQLRLVAGKRPGRPRFNGNPVSFVMPTGRRPGNQNSDVPFVRPRKRQARFTR